MLIGVVLLSSSGACETYGVVGAKVIWENDHLLGLIVISTGLVSGAVGLTLSRMVAISQSESM